jgi:hypothetical protein
MTTLIVASVSVWLLTSFVVILIWCRAHDPGDDQ